MPRIERPRNVGVDMIRAVAIGLVLGIHFFGLRANLLNIDTKNMWFVYRIFGHGYLGVNIFFVVSGFLIASTSIKFDDTAQPSINISMFYIRRITRIIPLIALTLVVAIAFILTTTNRGELFNNTFATNEFSVGFWLSIATFSFNWFRIFFGGTAKGWGLQWDILWSLAVEEQFYLTFPLLVTVLRDVKRIRRVLWSFVAAGAIARTILMAAKLDWLIVLTNSVCCFDGLAIGVLVALSTPWMPQARHMALFCGLSLLTAAYLCGFTVAWGLPVLATSLATALLLQAMRLGEGPAWAALPAAVGRLSYGIYLLHPLCFYIIMPWALRVTPMLGFAMASAASVVVAMASFWLFERPVERRLREILYGMLSVSRSGDRETGAPAIRPDAPAPVTPA